jgi:hypothetical protein
MTDMRIARYAMGFISLVILALLVIPPLRVEQSTPYDVPHMPNCVSVALSCVAALLLTACTRFSVAWKAVLAVLVVLGVAVLQTVYMRVWYPQVPTSWTVIGLEAVLLCALCCAFGVALRRRADGRYEPVCPCEGCGYELVGNTSGRCPECGRAIDHEVRACGTESDGADAVPPAAPE